MTQAPPPQQPVAPQPQYQPPPQPQGNGMAVAGMVLGIIGVVLICAPYIGLPCAIVAVILSALGKKKSKLTGTGGGMATAGLVLSIIALGLTLLFVILWLVGWSILGSKLQEAAMQSQQVMLVVRSFLA